MKDQDLWERAMQLVMRRREVQAAEQVLWMARNSAVTAEDRLLEALDNRMEVSFVVDGYVLTLKDEYWDLKKGERVDVTPVVIVEAP